MNNPKPEDERTKAMRKLLVGVFVLSLFTSFAAAQDVGCPAGQPASIRPVGTWVPTQDCQGWVPPNHPLAHPVVPTPAPAPTDPTTIPVALVQQDIYSALEIPTTAYGGLYSLRGWAVDCKLGSIPPVIDIIDKRPDGTLRHIPNDYFYTIGDRPDVQSAISGTCPQALSSWPLDPKTHTRSSPFGWTLALATPITEQGQHTITVVWTWEPQGHSGSTSMTITVR